MRIGFKFISTRVKNKWEAIQASFWFIPSIMLLGGVIIALFMISLDKNLENEVYTISQILSDVSAEGARSVLTTIAGSMATVAGVAFSITIVALSLASSQFGPRLLRNFMKDTGNQTALGTFTSTFIYCLIVLRSIHTGEDQTFVPILSVNLGMVFAIANVGMLIYFIHHVSTSIQADQIIAGVYHDLELQIEKLFPEALQQDQPILNSEKRTANENDNRQQKIIAWESGYLQAIDKSALLQIASKSDCIFSCQHRPGDFVVKGNVFLTIQQEQPLNNNLEKQIRDVFIFGIKRTPEQDAEFAIHQLVEVAIRALSPGVNDPYTALTCIDHLGSILCKLIDRKFPSSYLKDERENVRVIVKTTSFTSITNAAFDQIRQYGRTHVAVTIRLLEALKTIALLARSREQIRVIQHQSEMIERACIQSIPEKFDQQDILTRYRELVEVLAKKQSVS